MSRVTRSTLRAAALSALAASAFGLWACGDSDKESPTTPEAAPTTPAETTPAKTTPGKATPTPKAAVIPKVIDSKINVTGEGQNKIDSASEKSLSQDQVMAKVRQLMAALDKKGFDTKASKGNGAGPIVIQGGKATTVMVYPSEKMGARQAAGFTIVLKNSKTDARIARKGNILVAVSAPKGLTPALLKEFNTARKVAGV
jgi:hypothetical protein